MLTFLFYIFIRFSISHGEKLILAAYSILVGSQKELFCLQKYGKIDVVISNAAANPTVDGILETTESVLDKLWEINVKASILLLKVISVK